MSLFAAKSARMILPAFLVMGTLGIAVAQQTSRRPAGVPFTEPNAPASGTNASLSGSPKPLLGTLDQTIKKPFEFFKSDEAYGGGLTPPPRRLPVPAANTKQAKELLDRRKNWVFSTPEEIYGVQTPEEMLDMPEYTADGELKAPMTTFERYLERMEKLRANSNTNQTARVPSWMKTGEDEEGLTSTERKSGESGTAKESFFSSTTEAKPPANGVNFSSTLGGGSISQRLDDFFSATGGSTIEQPVMKDTAREARMLEFKQLLESRTPLASGRSGVVTPPRLPAAPGSPYSASPYSRDPYSPQPAARPAPVPAYTPTPAVTSPSYTPPAPAPSRNIAPAPAFELLKRKY